MRKLNLFSRLLIAVVAAVSVLGGAALSPSVTITNRVVAQGDTPPNTEAITPTNGAGIANTSALTPTSYLPIALRSWPLETVFGVETANFAGNAAGILGAKPTWVRRNALRWLDVQPSEGGAKNWAAAAALEEDMKLAAQNNVKLIVMIWGTPVWAQQNAGSICGPIRNDKIAAFAAFVKEAVQRYSQAPYNVKYWEIWNEPDFPSSVQANAAYGCWGNPSDAYYGGGYYASVIKQVAPQIRAADPAAKILMAGLLLDCSPDLVATCKSGKYLEGILLGGGAPHIDGVNFHAYDAYNTTSNTPGVYSWGAWSAWNTTGPSVAPKARFIKKVLNQYGVTGKFLINTEVALLCWDCQVAPVNLGLAKAYYIPQTYGAAISEGLVGNVWYSWEGWNQSQLVEPALTAYKVANTKLGGAAYVGAIGAGDVGVGGIKGYKFNRDGKALWLIWSLDGATKTVTLAGTPSSVTDALGAAQLAAATLQVTVKPLYIEFP